MSVSMVLLISVETILLLYVNPIINVLFSNYFPCAVKISLYTQHTYISLYILLLFIYVFCFSSTVITLLIIINFKLILIKYCYLFIFMCPINIFPYHDVFPLYSQSFYQLLMIGIQL